MSFWLAVKFSGSVSVIGFCCLAEHHHLAWWGLLLPRELHGDPWDGQKTAAAFWSSSRMGPLLKFTQSWPCIANAQEGKTNLLCPYLIERIKIVTIKRLPGWEEFQAGLKMHPRGKKKLAMAAWSWCPTGGHHLSAPGERRMPCRVVKREDMRKHDFVPAAAGHVWKYLQISSSSAVLGALGVFI